MSEDLYEIDNENLRSEISDLPEGRLRDYYREFILNHENVIKNFKIENYRGMEMRKAIGALCKLLFHEILKDEADNFYNDGGPDGNRFSLSQTDNSDGIVFFFKGKGAGRKKKSEIEKGEFVPGGEILQIGTALAATLNYSQNDSRYNVFKHVHETVYSYESNDKEHVCADVDKSKYSLIGKINDYESFVHNVLTLFDKYLQIRLAGKISSAIKSDFNENLLTLASEQAIKNEQIESLSQTLKDSVGATFPVPIVLITPTEIPEELLGSLTRFPWNLVVTFDPNCDQEGRLIGILRKEWSNKRPFKICSEVAQVGDGVEETNVIFANGNLPMLSTSKFIDWKNRYQSLFAGALSKIRRGSENICAVIISDKANGKIFNKAWLNTLSNYDEVLIIGDVSSELREQLDEDYALKYTIYDITPRQVAYVFSKITPSSFGDKSYKGFGLSVEDITRFAANGIKVVCPLPPTTEKVPTVISDFFIGAEISEKDLYNNFDVTRHFYEDLRKRIILRIESGSRFTHYIKQMPSSGATTIAKRLAYDIATQSSRGTLRASVLPIIISELKTQSINSLVERVKDLALKTIPSTHILAIIDRAVQSSDFDRLKETLVDGNSIRISFIRITEKEKSYGEHTCVIKDELTESEKVNFRQIFRRYADDMGLKNQKIDESLKYLIDFPLSLNGQQNVHLNIKEYVNSVTSAFNGEKALLVRRVLSIVGFGSKYIVNTDNYIEGFLFNSLLGKKFSEWYERDLDRKERKALERIIVFETIEKKRTGRLKTRFSKFNSAVIKLSDNSLADVAKDYIYTFFKDSIIASDPKRVSNYIIDLFFKKDGYEEEDREYIGKTEKEKFYKKLSSVFNDIHDPDSISLIFEELEKHISDYPRYLVAKAQYLYNRAYFLDSEEHDAKVYNTARDILELVLDKCSLDAEDESVVLQSLGVLNYRRLGALRKTEIKDQGTIGIAEKYLSAVERYCDKAFEINSYDTHALVTKAQALKSFLNMTKDIVQPENNNFEFCESERYIERTAQYEKTIELLGGFISTLDTTNLSPSQTELIKIFESLRIFSLQKLIGINEDRIYDIYRLRLESSRAGSELKNLYINRLFNVLIDAPKNEIRNGRIAVLSDEKLCFIENQLSISLRFGNLSSYEKIFRLHLFNGRKIYRIPNEIEWLKNWISKDSTPHSKLWGNFYIAMLYFAEVINEGHDFNGYSASADKFRKEAEKLAKMLRRNDTKELFFFRYGNGLQCITETAKNASYIEGRIMHIRDNRQGIAMLDCGLQASFAPKGEFLMEDADKNTRIRAKVGFRFGGLGLYGVERICNASSEDNIDTSSRPTSICNDPLLTNIGASPSIEKNANVNEACHTHIPTNSDYDDEEYPPLEEGYIYFGIYHEDKHGGKYITGEWKEKWIKFLNIDGTIEEGIYDEAEIEFSVKRIENKDNGEERWIATDVKFPEE